MKTETDSLEMPSGERETERFLKDSLETERFLRDSPPPHSPAPDLLHLHEFLDAIGVASGFTTLA